MQMIAGMQCWSAGDKNHWDVILKERRDLLAALLGAGSRWSVRFGCMGEKDRKDATWKG